MRQLFLEERLGLAARLINEKTIEFQSKLPEEDRLRFHQLMLDVIATLSGDPFGDVSRRHALDVQK